MDFGFGALLDRVEEFFGRTGAHLMVCLVWILLVLGVLNYGFELYFSVSDRLGLGEIAQTVIYLLVFSLALWVMVHVALAHVGRRLDKRYSELEEAEQELMERHSESMTVLKQRRDECADMHDKCREWGRKVECTLAQINERER